MSEKVVQFKYLRYWYSKDASSSFFVFMISSTKMVQKFALHDSSYIMHTFT